MREFPSASASFVPRDCNLAADDVLATIPAASRSHKVLSFCFVDPFGLGNLHFETIRRLSERFIDFLVLIPSYMDARRNTAVYVRPGDATVELFLGVPGWRTRWVSPSQAPTNFGAFVADQFGEQMKKLGYEYPGLADTVLVKHPQKNMSLYRLAFFSRNQLGMKFWQQAKKYTDRQLPLFHTN